MGRAGTEIASCPIEGLRDAIDDIAHAVVFEGTHGLQRVVEEPGVRIPAGLTRKTLAGKCLGPGIRPVFTALARPRMLPPASRATSVAISTKWPWERWKVREIFGVVEGRLRG